MKNIKFQEKCAQVLINSATQAMYWGSEPAVQTIIYLS